MPTSRCIVGKTPAFNLSMNCWQTRLSCLDLTRFRHWFSKAVNRESGMHWSRLRGKLIQGSRNFSNQHGRQNHDFAFGQRKMARLVSQTKRAIKIKKETLLDLDSRRSANVVLPPAVE